MSEVHFMPHQIEAMEKLHNGSILCAGVGTGKSITSLGYYYIYVCGGVIWPDAQQGENIGPMIHPRDLYIITTARKRDTHEWEYECEHFGYKNGKIDGCKVVIDSWNNLHKYNDVKNAFFIFDEQRVVGSGAWVKSFIHIARGEGNKWILLSATPGDTWSDYIPVFVANGFYKNRTQFLRIHAVFNRFSKYPKIDRWIDVSHLESLRRRITVTMEYEKKTKAHWDYILTDYDHEKYKRVCDDRWDVFKNEPIREIAQACYLMRKVSNCHDYPVHITENESYILDERSFRIFGIEATRHPRLIVFYNYDFELEALKTTLSAMRSIEPKDCYEVAEWNSHRHDTIPKTKRWFYLVQYMAGAEGWNCVETDAIIFYSQSYSYKLMTQAAGRIDRMNTPYTDLYYYIFKTDSSIDKAIDRALKGKKNFNEKNFLKWDSN